jgi:hypothetical protein
MWKPDFELLIAKAIADLINSKPRSPLSEELQSVLRGGYFTIYVVMGGGRIDHYREAIESMVAYRIEPLISLINARPRSPTIEEIRRVLVSPRSKGPAFNSPPAEGGGPEISG